MTELESAYRAVLGMSLHALSWRPIHSDTAGLLAELDHPSIEFSGAVSLLFEANELSLTWFNGANGDYHVSLHRASDWEPFSLGLVHASAADSWGALVGAQLDAVELFTHWTIPDQCAAVRHHFTRNGKEIELWIGVGGNGRIEGKDDLIARVGEKPNNAQELQLLKVLRR